MEYERQITYPRRHSHGPEGGNLVEGKGIAHSGLVLQPMGPLPYTQSDGKRWWRQAAEYFREGDMRELEHPFSVHFMPNHELTLVYYLGNVLIPFGKDGQVLPKHLHHLKKTERTIHYCLSKTNYRHGYERVVNVHKALQKCGLVKQDDVVVVVNFPARRWTAMTVGIPGRMTPVDVPFPYHLDANAYTITKVRRNIGVSEILSSQQMLIHARGLVELRRHKPEAQILMCAISFGVVWTEKVTVEHIHSVDLELAMPPPDNVPVKVMDFRLHE